MPTSYIFVFGRTPKLSIVELRSFFPKVEQLTVDTARVMCDDDFSPEIFILKLGGTVKIAKELGIIPALSAEHIATYYPSASGELHFGVSTYGLAASPTLLRDIKIVLESRGMRARYAIARHGDTLSSVTVDKSHITELIIIKTEKGFAVGITQAVQPYEEWGQRDYGRPYADAKSGMLPPKVARMLVNIARPTEALSSKLEAFTLLDPFCGMGTVLSEGFLAGWWVTGCDISKDIVQKAHDNLKWVAQQKHAGAGVVGNIFISDAVHVSDTLSPQSVNAIVTEPFMGATSIANTPNIDASKVKNIIKGLEKLYIGCLRDWSKVLMVGGVVVIALPEYAVGGRIYFVKKVIDMCEKLGYTTLVGPIAYGRPQATVKRNFYIFRYGTR